MANLAIRGHATRGKEVIEILKMLGGTNKENCWGVFDTRLYIINDSGDIEDISLNDKSNYQIHTLEEFLKKFPYKVGNKVLARGSAGKITDMKWQGDSFFTIKEGGEVVYTVMLDTEEEITFLIEDLQPYKEQETTELDSKTFSDGYDQGYDDGQHDMTEWNLPDGFIFKDENGNVINANKIVLEKKKPKYPKTYEECCYILKTSVEAYFEHDGGDNLYSNDYEQELEHKLLCLRKLLICRDAYWKIAGEQMGLGKSWEPDFTNNDEERYGIYTLANKVEKDFCGVGDVNTILVFPTEEMRDTFLSNEKFAQLISSCKEFL